MAKDTRKLERTIRIGNAVYSETDETAADQLQGTITPEQGKYLQDKGAISGDGWEFTGSEERVRALTGGATDPNTEPQGSPLRMAAQKGQVPGVRGQGGGDGGTDKPLGERTVAELEQEFKRRGLDVNDVQGSGDGGRVLKADMVKHLESNPGGDQGGE